MLTRRHFLASASAAAAFSRMGFARTLVAPSTPGAPWWKHALLYEIYPRSFQDSNGDGIGDLRGITSRLDYLQWLGVDAIWISPCYPSPQVDFGYDISDYTAIDPQYGTLVNFDNLVAEARKRNIRILMDMVLNHTSDQHPWFKESASSRDNPKRDWYIWRDGKPGGTPPNNPPTNWISSFGHSSWAWDPNTQQFYYHRFYAAQPDLNWRNPAVQKAMFDAMRFWLDRGVAGFRLDAITALFEDPELHDARVTSGFNEFGDAKQERSRYDNMPEEHDVLRRMRAMVASYPGDRVLVGETYLNNPAALDAWYGGDAHDELQLPMDMQVGFPKKLDATTLRTVIGDAQTKIHGSQPLFVFDNHDNIRSWERFGDGIHNAEIARLVATVLLTTRCTALMYYGQEIGMLTSTPERKELVKDPIGIIGWPKQKGRDGERTPMQWDATANAGFSTAATTWLPVPSGAAKLNVANEKRDPASLLNWYRMLITERRNNPALRDGAMRMLDANNASVFSFMREIAASRPVVVAVNCTGQPQTWSLAELGSFGKSLQAIATTAPELQHIAVASGGVTLPPFSSFVGRVVA